MAYTAITLQCANLCAMPRIQRRFLWGSRWTSLAPVNGACHFEVVGVQREHVILRAVLTGTEHATAIAVLEDPAVWQRGWQSRSM